MEQFNKYFVEILTKKYADFKGRARRKEYWMFFLFTFIIFFILGFLAGMLVAISQPLGSIFSGIMGLAYLAILVPNIAISVRRVQDCGKDWWYILIPIYNLILMFTEGDKGENAYGPDPKAGE